MRNLAEYSARNVAKDSEKFWKSRNTEPGPIDVIDMFSGCGGMSAGFLAANGVSPFFKLVAAVDTDPIANQTYESNLGLKPLCESVADLAKDPRKLRLLLKSSGRRAGHPLILIGCAPCQGFSSHRNGNGAADNRNSLLLDFVSVARILGPEVVIMENVPELLTHRHWPMLAEALRILELAGYNSHVSIQNMAGFGVPQERFRAVVVAMRRRFEPPRSFLNRGNFRTVRDAISHLQVVPPGIRDSSDPMHYSARHAASTIRTIKAVPKDGGRRPPNVGPACLRRIASKQGRGAYDDVYGRLHWDRPAITITAYARNPASGRFVHPEQDRGLTIREAALLQGFPMDYSFSGSLDDGFRQIGNAVPPSFSAYLALHVLGEMLTRSSVNIRNGNTPRGITQPIGTSFSRLIPSLKSGHRNIFT